ncbi:hypothetical protein GQS52_11040 [Streptomyces sp. SCUT-3]|uniref:hypothetical protein n=1 Tax=Streptomyces sp. SCUT-3 TaxID=2684469 RepID=UPI0015FAB759|nr:hypothetical protein [Streptomyces sp. SCUT-3]QMV22241.1 hypothetical protein GQS52_11040 [Streptomyces sp. SCUT-3]
MNDDSTQSGDVATPEEVAAQDDATADSKSPQPPGAPGPAPAPGSRRGRRTVLGVVAALVAVAAAVGVGRVALEQRESGTPVAEKPWAAPAPEASAEYGAERGGSHYGPLGKLLLPLPDGYEEGPDVGVWGNDVELTGKEAREMAGRAYEGLPAKERKAALKAVEALKVKGVGARTFQDRYDHDLLVEMQLVQMRKSGAKSLTAFRTELLEELGVFRNGPRIKGFDEARCFLPPKEKGQELDLMICFAHDGDLMVTMTAEGTSPLKTKDAADLLRRQLERIATPGEVV